MPQEMPPECLVSIQINVIDRIVTGKGVLIEGRWIDIFERRSDVVENSEPTRLRSIRLFFR